MNEFDTNVQYLKYRALKEIAITGWNNKTIENPFESNIYDIAKKVLPGPIAKTRCCIYKERAIFSERLKLAMGKGKEQIIQVLDIACDDCPTSGYTITSLCRGCIAHRCAQSCKKNAITFDDNQFAHIDKTKCVNCGMCARACQFSAIVNNIRPCEQACKMKAISMASNHEAQIDYEKCISCGACVYQCPFGAINDKSFILNAIKLIKNSKENKEYKVYAIVAPSISSQFENIPLGKVITGIKELGFYSVIETALGADMIADKESKELIEKGVLTSSCCPAFVSYIKKNYPKLINKISSNLSPMAELGKYIKENDEKSKVVFIGPCTAKKEEMKKEEVKAYIDCVLTFEELKALIDSKEINIQELKETLLDNASYYGRIFARSGGLKDAVNQALKENDYNDFILKATVCNGIEECKSAIIKLNNNVLDSNFIEGMACIGGCIGGPCCISHKPKDANEVDKYGKEALEKNIKDAIMPYTK